MTTKHIIYIGDSRNPTSIPDNSVHFCMWSPPYATIKDYNVEGQIGVGETEQEYYASIRKVLEASYRILKKGRRLVVVVGEQYRRAKQFGRYSVDPVPHKIIPIGMDVGFDFLGNILWFKISNRNPSGGASVMGSYPYGYNAIVEYSFEYLLIFKKYLKKGEKIELPEKKVKERSALTIEQWRKYFGSGAWTDISGDTDPIHPAPFPLKLAKRLIKCFSFETETVADLFLGRGTTTRASLELKRNSVGVELNRKYLPRIKEYVGINALSRRIYDFNIR